MKYQTSIAHAILALALLGVTGRLGAQPQNAEALITRQVQTYFAAMGKGQLSTISVAHRIWATHIPRSSRHSPLRCGIAPAPSVE